MATVTKPIALDESLNTTELSSRNVADVLAQELSAVATAIGGIAVPSADHVSYDNSGSGLTATDVQNALDEIVSDIPTVNDGVLTIQQNGTSKGSFTANSASNVNVNIETPTADKKTATDQFTTADGGLLSKCQINLVPVQSGSGDPSPDNVRPISGHTEVDLYNVGKNRATEPTNGVYSSSDGSYAGTSAVYAYVTAYVKPNTKYTLSCENTGSLGALLFYKGSLDTPTQNFISASSIGNVHTYTFTTPANCQIIVYETGGSATPIQADTIGKVQIEQGEMATAYEPYLGHLYQVQIGSTVYGGYVDLVSGVMNVDRVYIKPTAVASVTSSGGIYYWVVRNDLDSKNGANVISDKFKSVNAIAVGNCYIAGSGRLIIAVPTDQTLTTKALADAWCVANEPEFVYLLATPTTINLTPQQIETLAGQNNLSTPLDGQSIETNGVEYKELFTFADVKEYVDKNETIRSNTSVSGITLYRVGKVVTLTIASLSSEIGISGITIPYGFRPNVRVNFVGHAVVNNQDTWAQGFRVETTGVLTARSTNNNDPIAITWAVASTSYITTDD